MLRSCSRPIVATSARAWPMRTPAGSKSPGVVSKKFDAELLGEHPGGLVDLGAVQRQVGGLAAGGRRWAGVRASAALGVEQQHSRDIGEE
jgi:hypothetical protein